MEYGSETQALPADLASVEANVAVRKSRRPPRRSGNVAQAFLPVFFIRLAGHRAPSAKWYAQVIREAADIVHGSDVPSGTENHCYRCDGNNLLHDALREKRNVGDTPVVGHGCVRSGRKVFRAFRTFPLPAGQRIATKGMSLLIRRSLRRRREHFTTAAREKRANQTGLIRERLTMSI